MRKFIFILLLISFVFSCNKKAERKCWKPRGEVIIEDRMLSPFSELSLYDGIDYVLIQDSLDYVSITTGKNLIDFVQTNVEGGKLTIRDDNKCNWLRELPVEIIVEIHYSSITRVYNESFGEITGGISLPVGFFQWDNWNGATKIDLNLNLDSTEFALHTGATFFRARGQANMIWLFTSGYCQIDCSELTAANGQAHNTGIGDIYINVYNGWLNCVIEDYGNIYHSDAYGELHEEDRGEGSIFEY